MPSVGGPRRDEFPDDDRHHCKYRERVDLLRAEVERLTVEVGKKADELLTAWAKHKLAETEALAARPMLLIEQHQIRGNDHPLIVVRAVQGNALQQADYADARAANDKHSGCE